MAIYERASRTICLRLLTLVMALDILQQVETYRLTSGGRVPMGNRFNGCDNGVYGIEVDWNPDDKDVYACKETDANGKMKMRPKGNNGFRTEECTIQADEPLHRCLPEHIVYSTPLPTSGPHRPVWPAYGEYHYIPVQRWLHSLEHGAVVFLYHPCADKADVEVVKGVAQGCLRRHIISPSPLIPTTYNFAILAWKCKYLFQAPNVAEIVKFVKEHALKGPENVYQDGGYKAALKQHAVTVSDKNDTVLCPTSSQRQVLSRQIQQASFQGKQGGVSSKFSELAKEEAKLSEQLKNRFEPYKNIVDLSGGAKFFPNKESFSSDLKKGFGLLKKEEKELETDLKKSEEKLDEIRKELDN